MQPDLPTPNEQQVSSPSQASQVSPPTDLSAEQAPPLPGMQQSAIPRGGGKKKFVMILAVALIIIALFGGSAAAYFGVIVPNKPQNVLKKALANSVGREQLKSGQFDGEITVTGEDVPKELKNITFSGGFSQEENIGLNLTVNYTGGQSGAEMRIFKDQDSYIKLTGLENLTTLLTAQAVKEDNVSVKEFASTLTFLKKFNNQWIVVPQEFTKNSGATSSALSGGQLSDADAQKIAVAYKNHPFATITKNYPAEKVNDVNSYHYEVGVDKEQLKAFLTEVKNDNIKDLTITQADIDSVDKMDLSHTTIELWVAKSTKTVNKVKVVASDKDGKSTATVVVTLKQANKPYSVEKPTGAVPFEQILNSALESSTTF